ncbi:hypothetical protein ABK040_014818 [Willaertia magna]
MEDNDLLSLLVEANAQEGGLLTQQEIKSNAAIFALAGHETTSTLLQWTTYQLSKHPEMQKKAREELDRVLIDKRRPTYEDYGNLNYINAIIAETLRYHPPVGAVIKTAKKDVKIDGSAEINACYDYYNYHYCVKNNIPDLSYNATLAEVGELALFEIIGKPYWILSYAVIEIPTIAFVYPFYTPNKRSAYIAGALTPFSLSTLLRNSIRVFNDAAIFIETVSENVIARTPCNKELNFETSENYISVKRICTATKLDWIAILYVPKWQVVIVALIVSLVVTVSVVVIGIISGVIIAFKLPLQKFIEAIKSVSNMEP